MSTSASATTPVAAAVSARERHRALRLAGAAVTALTVVALVAWVLFLRPQFLGGSAAYVLVSGNSMEPTLAEGDLVLASRRDVYEPGDVVAFRVPKGDVGAGAIVIHRIVGVEKRGFRVKGDNRIAPDLWHPERSDIVGAQWLRVPHGATVLAFVRSPLGLGLLAALLAVFVTLRPARAASGPNPPGPQPTRARSLTAAVRDAWAHVRPLGARVEAVALRVVALLVAAAARVVAAIRRA